jgi:hypothetical protein
MSGKQKASLIAGSEKLYQGLRDRADQSSQCNQPAKNLKAFNADQHIRAARQAIGDAFVMLTGFPSRIRYSYFVGNDGKLIARAERRAGT